HGCTGKGNDQVRFEVSAAALAPGLKTIAPLREWHLASREDEIAYAKAKRVPLEFGAKKLYSIDVNLWGRSIEAGPLEDPWVEPPQEVYQETTDPSKSPSKPSLVTIQFEKGIPVGLNGKRINPLNLIARLRSLGGRNGVGRSDLVENRLVGIKSREIYEAPAAVILAAAHEALENMTLDRNLFHYKRLVAERYAELVYDGLWFTPLREALDAFVTSASRNVTGEIRVKLFKGTATVVGRRSPYSLYRKSLATYGKEDTYDRKIAEGFIQIWGLPYRGQRK
ncbi:MAG: argininosuccinate synthase, partial [Candidatus Omnitrophota bacterium]